MYPPGASTSTNRGPSTTTRTPPQPPTSPRRPSRRRRKREIADSPTGSPRHTHTCSRVVRQTATTITVAETEELECCYDDNPDESDVETLPAPFPYEVESDTRHGERDVGRQARPEGEDAPLGAGDDAAHDGDAPTDPRGPPGLLGGRHVLLQPRLDEVERLEEEAAAGARGRPGQEGLDDGVGGDVLLHGFTLLF